MKTVWVLTESYNDYDQHGDYLVTVFSNKPTIEDFNNLSGWNITESYYNHLINNGGGRLEWENSWYFLSKLDCGELYSHSN